MHEYEKNSKSQKYFELKTIYKKKIQSEAEKYKNKVIDEVMQGNRNNAYAALRKLVNRPGEQPNNRLKLQCYAHLSPE